MLLDCWWGKNLTYILLKGSLVVANQPTVNKFSRLLMPLVILHGKRLNANVLLQRNFIFCRFISTDTSNFRCSNLVAMSWYISKGFGVTELTVLLKNYSDLLWLYLILVEMFLLCNSVPFFERKNLMINSISRAAFSNHLWWGVSVHIWLYR